jgi:hypothetical protein
MAEHSNKLVGVAGVAMALCCLVGPAVLGAAAGAAIGKVLGVGAAVAVALIAAVLLRHWRIRTGKAC